MIELKEKAGIYAEENVINVLKEAFAKVYADGYRDGYKDREDEIPVDIRGNKTEYVDLGLPSGTLWSTDYERDGEKKCYQENNLNGKEIAEKIQKDINLTCLRYERMNNDQFIPKFYSEFEKAYISNSLNPTNKQNVF